MRNGFALITLVLLTVSTDWGWAEVMPRWVSIKEGPEFWATAKVILHDELSPDDPERTHPVVAMRYKYITRMLMVDDIALVVVAMRQGKQFHPSTNFYKAYTVDLKSKAKSSVSDIGYQWRFWKFARFESRDVPDVVYRFDSCEGCETTQLAGSFLFDSAARKWKIREWPKVGSEIAVGSAPQHGDDEDYYLDCLYAVEDFTDDGKDDFATWCRTLGAKNAIRSEVVTLYTIADKPEQRVLEGNSARAVRAKLCAKNRKSSWCR